MDELLVAQQPSTERASGLLRRALQANAAFSSISAVICIVGAPSVATWLGIASPLALIVFGLVVLVFAAWVLMITLRHPLHPSTARVIWWLDVAWVVASPIVLIVNPFSLTSAGQWAVGSVALIVLDIAILEYLGLRRIRR